MSYAAMCFLIAVVAVVLGYSAIATALAGFAKLLFLLGSAARLHATTPATSQML